jgi:cytoskeletal protein CcmA (bactofilin family)
MAIFNKSNTESNTTLIAAGTKIDGEFYLECKLHIDGKVGGKIDSNSIVSIGGTGSFTGELKASKLIVSGVFEGSAECESIELLKDGKILGKIVSKDLMIESNSVFEGESQLKKENTKMQNIKKDSAS